MADNNKTNHNTNNTTNTKHAGGRPKLTIDLEKVKTLAEMFCTQEEIAAVLNLSVDTLLRSKEFCEEYKKGILKAKSTLRSVQFAQAQNNVTMAIWLGKQYLAQRDIVEEKQEQTIQIVNDIPKINNIDNSNNNNI